MQSWGILIIEYYIIVVESWTSIRIVNEYRRTFVTWMVSFIHSCFIAVDDDGNMQCLRVDGCCGRAQWVLQIIGHYREESIHQETDSHQLRQNGNSAWSICCGKIVVEQWYPVVWPDINLAIYTTFFIYTTGLIASHMDSGNPPSGSPKLTQRLYHTTSG